MLTKRAKSYSSSCSQVILVYLHLFRRSSLFCSQKLPKNHVKSIFLWFKFIQDYRSSSSVLVMISSMAVPICNHLHARQANRV